MKKKNKFFLGILITLMITIILFSVVFKYQNIKTQTILNLTTEDKISDFNELCNILDECYPFWSEVKQAGVDKETVYREYRDNIEKTRTDIEYFKEIKYFLNEFKGYGHLSVLDGYLYRVYVETLTTSNGMLSEKESKAIEPLMSVLTDANSERTYHLLDQSHQGFRSTVGLKGEYREIENVNNTVVQSMLKTEILEAGKVAYIKILSFELAEYQADKSALLDFFIEIEGIPNLVIDIRGNSGGSDLYWKDLLVEPNVPKTLISDKYYLFNQNEVTNAYVSANEIAVKDMDSLQDPLLLNYVDMFSSYTIETTKFEPSESPYKGKIWVLVDDKVYSSSENFAMFCKNTGFATLVGTNTGGDGGIADPLLVSLPNSGLIVRFSMFYGLNADGSGNEANGTVPDFLISEDEDALDRCLLLIKERSAD